MADNTIDLKVRLDESDLAAQLLDAFTDSPQLAAQLSGALAPFVENIIKSEKGVEGLNDGLKDAIALSRAIQNQMKILEGTKGASLLRDPKGETDSIDRIRKRANDLIDIQKAGIEESERAYHDLILLQHQLNDLAEENVEIDEELARVAQIIARVKSATASSSRKDVKDLAVLANTSNRLQEEALEDLFFLRGQLVEQANDEFETQERIVAATIKLSEVDKQISSLRSKANKKELNDIQALINLSQTQTDDAQDALDILIIKREELNKIVSSGALNEEESVQAIIKLRKLEQATSDSRIKSIRGTLDIREQEKEEVRELGQLAKVNNEVGRKAVAELVIRRRGLLNQLEDETLERQKQLELAGRLADVEDSLKRNVGSGRAAQRRARSRGGPDTFGTLLNLERIIQDIPFGLVGIANNLGPFFDQFSFFVGQIEGAPSKVQKLKAAFGLLVRDLIFTPIGWITLLNVVTSLIIGGPKLKSLFIGVLDFFGLADKKVNELAENLRELTEENLGFKLDSSQLEVELDRINKQFESMSKALKDTQAEAKKTIDPLDTISARILDFFSVDTDSFLFSGIASTEVVKLSREVGLLGDQLHRLRKQAQETEAVVAADIQTILFGGEFSKLSDLLEGETIKVKDALAEQLAEIGQFGEQSLATQTEVIELQQAQREKELLAEVERFKNVRAEIVSQLSQIEDELTESQRRIVEQRITNVSTILDALFGQLDKIDEETDAKIEEARRKLEKSNQEENRRLKRLEEIKKAGDQIIDLELDLQQGIIASRSDTLDAQLELAALETDKRKGELKNQLRDYKGTESQRVEFAALIADRLLVLDQELTKQRGDLARDFARDKEKENIELIKLQKKIAETSLEVDSNVRTKLEQEERRHSAAMLEIRGQLFELSLLEQTEFNRKRVNLLLDLINAEKELTENRSQFIIETEQARIDNALKDLQFATQQSTFDLASSQKFKGETEFQEERRLARIALARRDFEERERFIAEKERIEEEFDEESAKMMIEELEREHENNLLLIKQEGANARDQQRKAEFDQILNQSISFLSQQANTLSQIADIEATISENNRRADLVSQGKTEQEINKIIEKESKKRLANKKKFAKIAIIASTAQAAIEAFRSAVEIPFLPPAISIPMGIAAAGVAIKFGAAQLRAVDSEKLSGAEGGGGAGVTVIQGIETPPGIQDTNDLVLGFQSPFDVAAGVGSSGGGVSGSAGMANQFQGLRSDIQALTAVNEGRPVIVDVPEENASRIVRSGLQFKETVERP